MGVFLDDQNAQSKSYKGKFIDEEIPIENKPKNIMFSGPISRGADYVQNKLSLKDIPYIVSKMGSEYFGGLPEMASKKPVISSLAGPFGASGGKDEGKNYFPSPVSIGGKEAGSELGLASGMLDPALAVSSLKGLIKKPVQNFGIRIMRGILRPKGELAEKGSEIAERALWEGLKGTKEGMLTKAYSLLQEGGKEIADIISRNKNKNIDMDIVFKELRDLRKKYSFAQNSEKVSQIDELIRQFKPEFKQPKVVSSYRKVGDYVDEFGETVPESKWVRQKRMVNRPVTLEEAQARKVAQYQDLAEGRSFPHETTSAKVAGRKAYARGFKKAVEKIVPEVSIPNKRFGSVSEVAQSLEELLPVDQRKELLGLGDIILGAAGTVSPKALTAGIARKALQWTPITSRLAHAAYKFGRKPPSLSAGYPLLKFWLEQNQ